MNPERVAINEFSIIGPQVETTNVAEMKKETGQIPKAWHELMNHIPDLSNDKTPTMFGAYFGYEGDHNGKYKVITGVKHSNQNNAACKTVQIKGGEYLLFSFKGEIPEAVIKGWQTVWGYFEQNPTIERLYDTDFEQYTADGVDIYIGVK